MLTSADWEELRSLARRNVEAHRRTLGRDVRLGAIDAAALRAAEGWLGRDRLAAWDWRAVTKRNRDARYEIAIWHADTLCGLGFGPVEGVLGMGRVCVEYIEGAPRPHPLQGQIIPIVLFAAEELARIMDVSEVRLLGAMRVLVPVYEAFGYEEVAGSRGLSYLTRRMASHEK